MPNYSKTLIQQLPLVEVSSLISSELLVEIEADVIVSTP